MNYIVKEAAALVAKMSPETLEAYKESTGVDIAKTIPRIQRKIKLWDFVFSLMTCISFGLAVCSLVIMMLTEFATPKHVITIIMSLIVFVASFLSIFSCQTWWTNDIEEFYKNARGLLLITKAPCSFSFEVQMNRVLLEAAVHLVSAERQFISMLNWPSISPELIREIADKEMNCRSRLNDLMQKAGLFGYNKPLGRLMDRAMKNRPASD